MCLREGGGDAQARRRRDVSDPLTKCKHAERTNGPDTQKNNKSHRHVTGSGALRPAQGRSSRSRDSWPSGDTHEWRPPLAVTLSSVAGAAAGHHDYCRAAAGPARGPTALLATPAPGGAPPPRTPAPSEEETEEEVDEKPRRQQRQKGEGRGGGVGGKRRGKVMEDRRCCGGRKRSNEESGCLAPRPAIHRAHLGADPAEGPQARGRKGNQLPKGGVA